MKEKILIFEDDRVTGLLLQRSLADYEYNVELFELPFRNKSYDEIKKIFKNVDLILMDIYLEQENGLNIYKKLQGYGFNIPVIFTTGLSLEDVKNTTETIPNCYFLIKPIEISGLLLAIGSLLYKVQDSNT